ncbi:MerR family transcriptional regulator [candidate division KSB1 bacterium]|nr:MerR family transcriptional regulator [candidate division KSB1 bacterium]
MKPKPIKKLYYSISEVSKLTALKQYVLRYWETEFSELRPAKNRAGNRIYRLNDIKLVFTIKKLLYEEKYTIEGARQKLKEMYQDQAAQVTIPLQEPNQDDLIAEIRADLQSILDMLNDKKNNSKRAELIEIDDEMVTIDTNEDGDGE